LWYRQEWAVTTIIVTIIGVIVTTMIIVRHKNSLAILAGLFLYTGAVNFASLFTKQ
jgi:hypothetical protein